MIYRVAAGPRSGAESGKASGVESQPAPDTLLSTLRQIGPVGSLVIMAGVMLSALFVLGFIVGAAYGVGWFVGVLS